MPVSFFVMLQRQISASLQDTQLPCHPTSSMSGGSCRFHLEALTRHLCLGVRAISALQQLPLLGAEIEVGIVPGALEADRWVQNRQAQHSDNNHDWLEDHKGNFVTDKQLSVEPTPEFDTAIDGTDHDGDGGNGETDEEGFEEEGVGDADVFLVPVVALGAEDGEGEVATCEEEEREAGYLEDETSDHDVAANVV